MATEPMLAKLLICGIKKAYYVVNILQSTLLKIQILVLVHYRYLQNKHVTLACKSNSILTVHLKESSLVRFPPMALFGTIPDQSPAIIRHRVNVPTTLISFFHCPNVLMEPLPLFLANTAKIAWEIVEMAE